MQKKVIKDKTLKEDSNFVCLLVLFAQAWLHSSRWQLSTLLAVATYVLCCDYTNHVVMEIMHKIKKNID